MTDPDLKIVATGAEWERGMSEVFTMQQAEFSAFAVLAKAVRAIPQIVDDGYPGARHQYESALRDFLSAVAANTTHGRLPWGPASSVLQSWAAGLTFMQQTVLLAAVRGPDGTEKYAPIKYLLRWYRRCILLSSLDKCVLTDPHSRNGGSFMGPSYDISQCNERPWPVEMADIVSQYLRSLDGLPHHFQMHFMHAVEIVGYKHPDRQIRAFWHETYLRLVHDLHLWPETEAQMDKRLGDSRADWLARNDRATVD
ncbi:hypothetical protein sos41_11680 [Alphaproteobacteria bacterium SO-S41]|nr:hypothetical protein sos41_11680 [Alphaproteobacteria bacterium SO-S41]